MNIIPKCCMVYFRSCIFKDPKAPRNRLEFVSAKGKDKSKAKRAEQRRKASHPLEQTTGCLTSQSAGIGIVLDKYLLKHPSNLKKLNLADSQCNVSLDRGREPHPLESVLPVLEHPLLTDRNVFSQWAELGGCGPALIQTQGGNIQAAPSMSQGTQPLLRSLAWVQCVQRGWLCPTAPSGKGQSVCKEHSGDPQIPVMANN